MPVLLTYFCLIESRGGCTGPAPYAGSGREEERSRDYKQDAEANGMRHLPPICMLVKRGATLQVSALREALMQSLGPVEAQLHSVSAALTAIAAVCGSFFYTDISVADTHSFQTPPPTAY